MSTSGRDQWFKFWEDHLTQKTWSAVQEGVAEAKLALPISIQKVEEDITKITQDIADQKKHIEEKSTPDERMLSDGDLIQAIKAKENEILSLNDQIDDELDEIEVNPQGMILQEEIFHIQYIMEERNKYRAMESALSQKNNQFNNLKATFNNIEEIVLRNLVDTVLVPADLKENRDLSTEKKDQKSPPLTDKEKKYNAVRAWSQALSARGSHQSVKGFTLEGEPTAYWERITGKGISTLNMEHQKFFGMTLFEKYEQRGHFAKKYHLNPLPFDKWLESYVSSLSQTNPNQKGFLNAYQNMIFLKTEEERIPYKVKMENGNIYVRKNHPDKPYSHETKPDKNGWVLADSTELKQSDTRGPGVLIFAYNVDTKELYLAQPVPGVMHHSSFLDSSNHNVIAGTFTTQNGKITNIGNDSGHYRNSEADFLELCAILQEKNVLNLNSVILVKKEVKKSPQSPDSYSEFTDADFKEIKVERVKQILRGPEIATFLEPAIQIKQERESGRNINKLKEFKRTESAKRLLRSKVASLRNKNTSSLPDKKGSPSPEFEWSSPSASSPLSLSPTDRPPPLEYGYPDNDGPPPLEPVSPTRNDDGPPPLEPASPIASSNDSDRGPASPIHELPQSRNKGITFFFTLPPNLKTVETLLQTTKKEAKDDKFMARKQKEIHFLQSILDNAIKQPSSLKEIVKQMIATDPSSYNSFAKDGRGDPTEVDKLVRKILKEDYDTIVKVQKTQHLSSARQDRL